MNIVVHEPWNMMEKFQHDMNRLFDEARHGWPAKGDDSSVVTSRWTPAVDIKEEPDRYVLKADVPGIDPKDIEVTMENGVLILKGERSHEEREETENYKRMERVYGMFYRRFSLPDTADAEQIRATCRNGVLEVVIPKHAKLQPRRIEVQQ